MSDEALAQHIRLLEDALANRLTPGVIDDLESLLADDFLEIGRSGVFYTKNDIVAYLGGQSETVRVDISNFTLRSLGEGLVQCFYTTSRSEADDSRSARRSSIWRQERNDQWRIVFHQGTPL